MRKRDDRKTRYRDWLARAAPPAGERPHADQDPDDWRQRVPGSPPTAEYLAARAIMRQCNEDDDS
jgi:hypothetical protein